MNVNKAHLIDHLYRNCDLSREESISTIDSLLEIIKHTLESGENLLISGFGTFILINKKSRRGRNPQTGNDLRYAAWSQLRGDFYILCVLQTPTGSRFRAIFAGYQHIKNED